MKNLLFFLVLIVSFANCSATATHRSAGEMLDDAVITNKLKTKYMKDKQVKAFKIDVDTWKGIVSLRGKVESQDQIYRAIELAEQQQGVKEVKSYLVVQTAGGGLVEEKDIVESTPQAKRAVEPRPAQKPFPQPVVEEREETGFSDDNQIPSVTEE